jgi:hypothetical protein
MVRLGYPPEVISSYAVQELLIMHPFKDGNGRTARLLGQILYKKLTGKTILFPAEFHKEMSYPLHELASKLFADPASFVRDSVTMNGVRNFVRPKSMTEISELAYRRDQVLPQMLDKVAPVSTKVKESEFPDFQFDTRKIDYKALPDDIRHVDQEVIYYGRTADSDKDAEKMVRILFEHGRTTRGNAHYDLARHVSETDKSVSGFFPASKNINVAERFTMSPGKKETNFGIIFLVDPRGGDVLDVDKFYSNIGSMGYNEKEVIFANTLTAERVRAAIVVETQDAGSPLGDAHIRHFFLNPNYRPPQP